MTQVALAEAASITRQSLSAIESGRVDPSVSIALRIGRALDFPVEDLFGESHGSPTIAAELADAPQPAPGARVALAFVQERWVAHPVAAGSVEAADGLVREAGKRGQRLHAEIEPLRPLPALRDNFLILGCAPALGLLVRRLNLASGPGHFLWLERASTEALDELGRARAHAAGVHLPRPAKAKGASERKLKELERFTLVRWQLGLVIARGNPLGIGDVRDLARSDLRICARQPGAGSQQVLERELMARGLRPSDVLSKARIAPGHHAAAGSVALGASDVAIAMENAALSHELDFLPFAEERFDIVVPSTALSDPRVVRALELMNSGSFRQELRALGGYDASDCGRPVPRDIE